MRLLSKLLWVAAVFPIGGCTEVTGPSANTAPVEITVHQSPVRLPLAGVEVCEIDNAANCETTDADGKATLWLPVDETSFTTSKEGYGSYLKAFVNRPNGYSLQSGQFTETLLEVLHDDTMTVYPMGDMGRVHCSVQPAFEGATFDLHDADGPVTAKQYFDEVGPTWSLDHTATAANGAGGFLEVSPGDEYQVQFGGTAQDCVHVDAWPGRFLPNAIRFPVRAGYITQVSAACSGAP